MAKDKEKEAARKRAYDKAHREEIRARKKAYKEANREKERAYQAAYYEAHREKHRVHARESEKRRRRSVKRPFADVLPIRLRKGERMKAVKSKLLGRLLRAADAPRN